jgi:hypothetical protein
MARLPVCQSSLIVLVHICLNLTVPLKGLWCSKLAQKGGLEGRFTRLILNKSNCAVYPFGHRQVFLDSHKYYKDMAVYEDYVSYSKENKKSNNKVGCPPCDTTANTSLASV